MSKDKRGRKCKGRHCAWCRPVINIPPAHVNGGMVTPKPYYLTADEVRRILGFPPVGSGMQIAQKDGTLWNG